EPRSVRQRSSSPFRKAVRWQSRSSLSKNRSPKRLDASAESRCTCARDPASGVPPRSGTPSAAPARGKPGPVVGGYSQRSLSAVVWARIPRGTCSPTWSGLGFDKHPTFDPPTSWSSSHLGRIILRERSNLFKSHWSNQWLALRVTQARGNLENAVANVNNLEAAIAVQEAVIKTNEANLERAKAAAVYAQATAQRFAELAKQGIVSRDQGDQLKSGMDQADAQVRATEAQLNQSRAQLGQSRAQLGQAQAQVKTAQGALDLAETNLRYCTIISPIDGTVVARNVTV